MSRDHRKLRVFQDAYSLTLAIYQHTRHFPKDEWFASARKFVAQRSPSPAISLKEMRRRQTAWTTHSDDGDGSGGGKGETRPDR